MSRRPEIGNIQLYPNRPLTDKDKNGYTLKFFCPIRKKRVRKNCGTRDRREARRILRECQERLQNGEYLASGGAVTKSHVVQRGPHVMGETTSESKSWQECYERYRENRETRIRESSMIDIKYRLGVAERIFQGYRIDRGLSEGLPITQVMTREMLEYLQDRLLAGDECRFDRRSPSTVNSTLVVVVGFARFCDSRGWISAVPQVEKLSVEDAMKGRPLTEEEFNRMLEATPAVVGPKSAESWTFALRILWENGFRVGDLMDFHWDDSRHCQPRWPNRSSEYPTISIPSSQKNGKVQEIPMLPGLSDLLKQTPVRDRKGWIANPQPMTGGSSVIDGACRPSGADLQRLSTRFSNCSIGNACCVSEMTVRNWMESAGIIRDKPFKHDTGEIPSREIAAIRKRSEKAPSMPPQVRLTKERVSRVIAMIGEEAGIVVQHDDPRTGHRKKFASAHDIRRGCARRLIDLGVSAETLKVIMRHSSFSTTEKHYGALRSVQSAAAEVAGKLTNAKNGALVGGFVGGLPNAPQLSAEELMKLKSLLNSI